MLKINIKRDVTLTLIGVIAGLILGVCVSEYFYDKSKIDTRKSLIESAINDIERWQSKESYPQLYDSLKYCTSGSPWPKLSVSGIEILFRDIKEFSQFKYFDSLVQQVSDCKRKVDAFNDRIFLRNISIVSDSKMHGLAAQMSPMAYHYFQTSILPVADSLHKLLNEHKENIISD